MARKTNRLTAISIDRMKAQGRFADGGGLWLNVTHTGSKSWVFRWTRKGKVREMGVGPFPAVSLANARRKVFEYREMVANGLNPKFERDRQDGKTFGEVADTFLEDMKARWTTEKSRNQWKSSLNDYCSPIRNRLVAEIETSDVLKILNPIWSVKAETASRVRMRIESVLDYAKAKGWREADNPARWRGHLSNILPARQSHTKRHHPAMEYGDLPDFIVRLRGSEALAARALDLLILTASRTSEVLKAEWSEFNLNKAIWVIPAERMKAKRDHRIPLTDDALEILKPLYECRVSDFVFPGQKLGRPLSGMAMEMLLRRMKVTEVTVHGFRSTFRDWCGDKTSFPREIAEAALAHSVGSAVELAYRRSDALEKRRQLMNAWADYCGGVKQGKVVQLHG